MGIDNYRSVLEQSRNPIDEKEVELRTRGLFETAVIVHPVRPSSISTDQRRHRELCQMGTSLHKLTLNQVQNVSSCSTPDCPFARNEDGYSDLPRLDQMAAHPGIPGVAEKHSPEQRIVLSTSSDSPVRLHRTRGQFVASGGGHTCASPTDNFLSHT